MASATATAAATITSPGRSRIAPLLLTTTLSPTMATTPAPRTHFDSTEQPVAKRSLTGAGASASASKYVSSNVAAVHASLAVIRTHMACYLCRKLTTLCARQSQDREVICFECILSLFQSSANAGTYTATRSATGDLVIKVLLKKRLVPLIHAFVEMEPVMGDARTLMDVARLLDPTRIASEKDERARTLSCRACRMDFPAGQVKLSTIVEHFTKGTCTKLGNACAQCNMHVLFQEMEHHQVLHQTQKMLGAALAHPNSQTQQANWQAHITRTSVCGDCKAPLIKTMVVDGAAAAAAAPTTKTVNLIVYRESQPYHMACLSAAQTVHLQVHADEAPPCCAACTKCDQPLTTDSCSILRMAPSLGCFHPACFAKVAPEQFPHDMDHWAQLSAADQARLSGMWGPRLSMPALQTGTSVSSSSHGQLIPPAIPQPSSSTRARLPIPIDVEATQDAAQRMLPSLSMRLADADDDSEEEEPVEGSTPPCSQPRRRSTPPPLPPPVLDTDRMGASQHDSMEGIL
jgi:hypothetical protein